ncbi:Oxidoreductase family, NAD-binding Rossmann fold [Novipirellula galeiformis]|uniref:Oxidoreductase family, NAD-binding Rossmann fold n=1 Tax=Novipirellula galeiformis TaxID=2528004 RepID=A0A5C6BDK2_9BACT|nr:Gfo/Idh/MocA family oxidoreductase [Novipirellula galeiformis]TWU10295.1 Oxidoreductase family, NAD-binding Rossmann fold [Novipirellula galeiformis]
MMKRNVWLLCLAVVFASLPSVGRADDGDRGDDEEPVFRLGMIGLDTSHVIAFTRYLNNPKNKTGCRVVAGFPGGSPDFPASANRVEKFTEQLRDQHGLEIVNSIEQLCEKVDGILLESVDGRPHLDQAKIVIQAGKPLWVDKPVTDNLADVIELFRLAKENNVPCWSSSAARYYEGVAGAQDNEELGQIVACDVFGSSSWAEFHPSLYLYGIHAVEPLFTVLGTGCETVQRIKTDRVDTVIGLWTGGRVGTFRDLRGGKADFTTIIYGKNKMVTAKSSGYAPLLKQIVEFFKTGNPPVSAEETIEIYAFMSAADESQAQGGAPVSVAKLIEQARGGQAQGEQAQGE